MKILRWIKRWFWRQRLEEGDKVLYNNQIYTITFCYDNNYIRIINNNMEKYVNLHIKITEAEMPTWRSRYDD